MVFVDNPVKDVIPPLPNCNPQGIFLLDPENKITRYNSIQKILTNFFTFKVNQYRKINIFAVTKTLLYPFDIPLEDYTSSESNV